MKPRGSASDLLGIVLAALVVGCSGSGPATEGTSREVESRAVPLLQPLQPLGPLPLGRFRAAPPGPPPTNITAYMTPTAASLRWSPLPDVLGYTIRRAPTPAVEISYPGYPLAARPVFAPWIFFLLWPLGVITVWWWIRRPRLPRSTEV